MAQVSTPAGLALEYEAIGDPADPALLLVAGLGAQLVAWQDGFCARLAAGGRYVVRFDNRDCGRSSKLADRPVDVAALVAAASAGDLETARALAPYTLSDMADDAFALLDGLGIERAHVVGSSLGGAVAQTMAIEHPERVLTLTSMMSATGEPEFGQSTPEALAALLAPVPTDRDAVVDAAARSAIWSSRRWFDLDAARALAAVSYDRGHAPDGTARQLAAAISAGSRAEALRHLQVPTLVIHGLDDTLITPSGGERTAALVPDARLLLVEDMGHDRPEPLWPRLGAAILDHTERPAPAGSPIGA